VIDARAFGYPVQSLADVPPGRYRVLALALSAELHRVTSARGKVS